MVQDNQNIPSNKVHTLLTHRYFPVAVAILAVILALPSLNAGLFVDDYHHKLLMDGSDSPIRLLKSPLDMFCFFDGDPQRTAELIDYGFPWWTYKGIKGAFWRPLASITHWLDYILWPDTPALMHAQNILWYGALIIAVTFLYRRFITATWVVSLAALLYAIDDAHGMPVGFIANRNAVMATFFGILTIIAHDKWRRENWRLGIILGPLLLTISLLSAEAGIATCVYLAAHVFFIDRSPWRRRFASMIPYVAVVIIWRFLWSYLDYGVADIGAYVDPLNEPLRYITAVKDRAPFFLLGQLALPPSDIATMISPQYSIPLWRIALFFLVLLTVLLIPILRRQRSARFWAMGMLLSVLPICATFVSDRLLLFVGIGAMGLVAQFISVVFGKVDWRPKIIFWRVPAVMLAVLFIMIHLFIAPFAFTVRAYCPMVPKQIADKLMIAGPLDESVENQDLIIINPPVAFVMLTSPLIWEANNYPMPRHIRVLTSSLFQPVEVHRPDAGTLIVKPRYGYYVYVLDALFRNEQHPFSVGDRVELTGMTVEIKEMTDDGRASVAAFKFSVPLEDPSLRWLQYKNGEFIPFTPPPIGQSVVLQVEKLSLN
jgi:hypothetical protein